MLPKLTIDITTLSLHLHSPWTFVSEVARTVTASRHVAPLFRSAGGPRHRQLAFVAMCQLECRGWCLLPVHARMPCPLGSSACFCSVLNCLHSPHAPCGFCGMQLPYDFQYHASDFPVDIPMLILSQGKSMTPADCVVPLSTSASLALASTNAIVPSVGLDIPATRQYLCAVRGLPHALSPEVSSLIEDDMVTLRATTPVSVSAL